MGIVKKQALINTILTYLGIAIGFVNSILLFPLIFSTEEFGLRSALLGISAIYCQFSALGVTRILIKFYPYFKSEKGEKNKFLSLALIIGLVGFSIFTIVFLLFTEVLISRYSAAVGLLIDYVYLVIPLSFFTLFSSILESYLFSLHKTIFSHFLKTTVLKLLWLIEILLYIFNIIEIHEFWILFSLTSAVNFFALIGHLILTKEFSLTFNLSFRKREYKVMSYYGLFTIISGAGQTLVGNIDKIMVMMLATGTATITIAFSNAAPASSEALELLGIYTMGLMLGGLVSVPLVAMMRIVTPILATEIKQKNWGKIEELYKKSSLNMFLIGGMIFNCIWLNRDNFYEVLKKDYDKGVYVLLAFGLCKLYDMITGVNGQIILLSKHYRFDAYTSLGLIGLVVVSNLILIPMYGINGAAYATLIAIVVYNTVKMFFVYHKFEIQPFTGNTIKAIGVILVPLLVMDYVPFMGGFMRDAFGEKYYGPFTDMALRSGIVCAIVVFLIWIFKVSEDINSTIEVVYRKLVPKES